VNFVRWSDGDADAGTPKPIVRVAAAIVNANFFSMTLLLRTARVPLRLSLRDRLDAVPVQEIGRSDVSNKNPIA
jgi:hypothetical protein